MEINRNHPFVSIIVPVYNGEQTVVQCAEALFAQNYPKDRLEIIFVDNKSKDRSFAKLQPYAEAGKILLLSETKALNAYGARNKGISVAMGEIIAFTDADCIPDPQWILELVNGFENPMVGCVSGDIITAPPKNVIDKYYKKDIFVSHVAQTDYVLGGNCAFRREIFNLVGNYRADIPSGGDVELPVRMKNQTKFIVQKNHEAKVLHQHTGTLPGLIKQQMRYGTSRRLVGKPNPEWAGGGHVFYLATFSLRRLFHFSKRLFKVLLKIDHDRSEDLDIYLARPLLDIVTGWSPVIGYHIAVKNQNLIR